MPRRKAPLRPFPQAREYARSLGFESQQDWFAYSSAGKLLPDLPGNPRNAYRDRGWIDWADFLGSSRRAQFSREKARSYDESRSFVRSLHLTSMRAYYEAVKSPDFPSDIPTAPHRFYAGKGWQSWSDFLGLDDRMSRRRSVTFRPFEEARDYSRSLRLGGVIDWREHARMPGFPHDIPTSPDIYYAGKGWAGWGEFLGSWKIWNRNATKAFLEGLRPILRSLTPAELYAILLRKRLIDRDFTSNESAAVLEEIESLLYVGDPLAHLDGLEELLGQPQAPKARSGPPSKPTGPPRVRSIADLTGLNHLKALNLSEEDELIQFIVQNHVALTWQAVLDRDIDPEALRSEPAEGIFGQIRDRFLEQYDGATLLPLPAGYAYTKDGRPVIPNLMQRLTAYRVLTERRIGNWSGVGAGKTLSAVLSSRVIAARLTMIVAYNSTLQAWAEAIRSAFPTSVVHVKEEARDLDALAIDPSRYTYLVLNYESFQQPWSPAFIADLTHRHEVDFVVLDEIQLARQRHEAGESRRRRTLVDLVDRASARNPDLGVLAMSATPVINNLVEAVKLLELTTGLDFSALPTAPTISNAIRTHEKLVLHGIRTRPDYPQSIVTTFPEVDGTSAVADYLAVPRRRPAEMDRVSLEAKLPLLIPELRPGTFIYSHYTTSLIPPLRAAVERAALTTGLYTGEDKSGLDAFLSGSVDVLIGSAPIGTGVDGLQRVCNRLVFVSLPWTAAEYEQIVGRLHRQGSAFDKVEVAIPQVVLRDGRGREWSWDKDRYRVISSKRTLADAALDGVIPRGDVPSPDELAERSLRELESWLAAFPEESARESDEEAHGDLLEVIAPAENRRRHSPALAIG